MKKNSALANTLAYLWILSSLVCAAGHVCSETALTVKSHTIKSAEKALRMQDFERAFSLYHTAALAGDAEGQYQISNMLTLGTGGEVDKNTARQWLLKSANQNHPAAMYQLGMLLRDDDKERANEFIHRSAQLNYPPALGLVKRRDGLSLSGAFEDDDDNSLWFGAARKNSAPELARLLAAGQVIDQIDKAGRTALFAAIESQSIEAAVWLLANDANPNHRDKFGDTPVFAAARIGNHKTLSAIFKAGGSASHTLKNGDNLWHYIIRLQNKHLAELVLRYKTPINQRNNDGWTPLDLAEYTHSETIITMLMAKGAVHGEGWNNVTTTMEVTSETFYEAKGDRHVSLPELVKVLLAGNLELTKHIITNQPALLNQTMADGSHLLLLATNEKNFPMIELLIKRKAAVNQPGSNGITALHSAARQNHVEAIKALLAAGADPMLADHNTLDSIDWALQSKHSEAALYLLGELEHRKPPPPYSRYLVSAAKFDLLEVVAHLVRTVNDQPVDEMGRSAMWHGAYNRNDEMLTILTRAQRAQLADKQGKTPFYVAVERNCLKCADMLFDPQFIDASTQSGDTPLIAAAAAANPELVQWLISKNADIEIRNALGNNALIAATQSDALEVVKLLVASKAKIGKKNKLGFSALDIAEQKNPTIFEFLNQQSILGIFN